MAWTKASRSRLSITAAKAPLGAAWRTVVRFILSKGYRFKKLRPSARKVMERLNDVDRLKALKRRSDLKRTFREAFKRLERLDRYAKVVQEACEGVSGLLLMVLVVTMPTAALKSIVGDDLQAYASLDVDRASGFSIMAVITLFFGYGAVVEMPKLAYRFLSKKALPTSLPLFTHFSLPIVLSYLIYLTPLSVFRRVFEKVHSFNDLPSRLQGDIAAASRGSSSDFFLAFALLCYLSGWASRVIVQRRGALNPDAIVVSRLVDVVATFEQKRRWATDVDLKQRLLRDIEQCARTIERLLPSRLKSGDISTDRWTRESARQIANAIRVKKKSVVTPSADTTKQLLPFFTNALLCVTTGNWDGLERAKIGRAHV